MNSQKNILQEKDGSHILSPEFSAIPAAIERNSEIFSNFSFEISGMAAKDFRSETRKELLLQAEKYTGALLGHQPNIAKTPDIKPVIIQTGHQPGFFHPGIMIKYPLLDLISGQTYGTGVNLVVDNDTAESTAFNIPSHDKPDITYHVDLLPEKDAIPLEYLRAPAAKELNRFLATVEKILAPHLFSEILKNFLTWKKSLTAYPYENLCSATDFFVMARRVFFPEEESPTLDMTVSSLSESVMFSRFFLHIARHAEEFLRVFNSELSEYRTRHRVRYPVNPFPDLKETDDTTELPFWFFENRKRNPLSVRSVKGEKVLFSGETEITAIPDSGNDAGFHSVFKKHIRPKAIPLTLFNRLFFSDIFIHGTGGGKYDEITDGIIKKFFRTPPPEYITASMTKFPDINISSESFKIEMLEKKLRNITFNPDRYMDNSDDDIQRKLHLLSEIKRPEANRKKIGIEIKCINQKLLPRLIPLKEKLTAELSDLREKEKKYKSFMRRDFPFCFFSPEEITASL